MRHDPWTCPACNTTWNGEPETVTCGGPDCICGPDGKAAVMCEECNPAQCYGCDVALCEGCRIETGYDTNNKLCPQESERSDSRSKLSATPSTVGVDNPDVMRPRMQSHAWQHGEVPSGTGTGSRGKSSAGTPIYTGGGVDGDTSAMVEVVQRRPEGIDASGNSGWRPASPQGNSSTSYPVVNPGSRGNCNRDSTEDHEQHQPFIEPGQNRPASGQKYADGSVSETQRESGSGSRAGYPGLPQPKRSIQREIPGVELAANRVQIPTISIKEYACLTCHNTCCVCGEPKPDCEDVPSEGRVCADCRRGSRDEVAEEIAKNPEAYRLRTEEILEWVGVTE